MINCYSEKKARVALQRCEEEPITKREPTIKARNPKKGERETTEKDGEEMRRS